MGGPPLVSPIRVKVGGTVRNEEEERDTWFIEIPPSKIISMGDVERMFFESIIKSMA